LIAFISSSCSGVGLPFSFVARAAPRPRLHGAPGLVGREQLVEDRCCALARERGA